MESILCAALISHPWSASFLSCLQLLLLPFLLHVFIMSRQPKPKPPHKLHMTTNSLRNTIVSADDDSIFFEIVTRFWHPYVTKINKTDIETREVSTVAEIERTPGREPRVRFGAEKGEWMSATDFVKYDAERSCV